MTYFSCRKYLLAIVLPAAILLFILLFFGIRQERHNTKLVPISLINSSRVDSCSADCNNYCRNINHSMNSSSDKDGKCNCICNPDWNLWCDDKCNQECSGMYYHGYIIDGSRCGCKCDPLISLSNCSATCNSTCMTKQMSMKNYTVLHNVCQCECQV